MGRHSLPDDTPTEILTTPSDLPPRGAGITAADEEAARRWLPPAASAIPRQRSWAATGLENAFGPEYDPLTALAMGVPVIPGSEDPMHLRPARPDYVHPGAHYVPLELSTDHRPPRRRAGLKTLIGVALGTAVAATGLALAADDPEPQDPGVPTTSVAPPAPAPRPPAPEEEG